jgi:hypothetical protein
MKYFCAALMTVRAALMAVIFALSPTAFAQTPATPIDAQLLDTTRQLLDWLGVDALLEQTPQIADQALQSEAKFRNTKPAQQAEWRRQLITRINVTALRERLARRAAEQLDPQTQQQALTLLQMPLSRRARYFELAMAQSGAGRGFQEFRATLDNEPTPPARRLLIRTLSAAAANAALLAQWQTALSTEVQRIASGEPADNKIATAALQERERHLTPLAEVYALYAFRYLTDEELGTYRDTLNNAAIQRVLEVCRRNLALAFTE